MIAARHEQVELRNYNIETGAEERDERYSKNHWMPTYGVVYINHGSRLLYMPICQSY
ncbi:hypothetical protein ARAF_2310 [Arsenophonus endosymbiont of Aleurodicus floccissimus]|nr:hypothetical protein ARAF_2310 [Arsenophonus endosymbiont of Aleurodicus floccissimus]